jgi:type I site-specific restriction endonuclease
MPLNHNEAFSRVLIDRALDNSGWDLLDSKQKETGSDQPQPANRQIPVWEGTDRVVSQEVRIVHILRENTKWS